MLDRTSMRSTPARSTPARSVPVHSTPVRSTPARSGKASGSKFNIGDRIHDTKYKINGVIKQVNSSNGTYNVDYEDGSLGKNIHEDKLVSK